jgi:hypothetical protein
MVKNMFLNRLRAFPAVQSPSAIRHEIQPPTQTLSDGIEDIPPIQTLSDSIEEISPPTQTLSNSIEEISPPTQTLN